MRPNLAYTKTLKRFCSTSTTKKRSRPRPTAPLQNGANILRPITRNKDGKLSNIIPTEYISNGKLKAKEMIDETEVSNENLNENENKAGATARSDNLSENAMNRISNFIDRQHRRMPIELRRQHRNSEPFSMLNSNLYDSHSGVNAWVDRKYETLYEQCENIEEISQKEILKRKQAQQMRNTINNPTKPLTMHENWNYFDSKDDINYATTSNLAAQHSIKYGVSGNETDPNAAVASHTMFSEPETWNVISHINKRYSFGKSLRYSDRFYRNWAIKLARELEQAAAGSVNKPNPNQSPQQYQHWKARGK